jgi:hypothetical protein
MAISSFWALPLLGITKLKAREILPDTLMVMILGVLRHKRKNEPSKNQKRIKPNNEWTFTNTNNSTPVCL